MEPLLLVVLGLFGVERAGEIGLNRRNSTWLRARGAVWHAPDGFSLIVASQGVLFAGIFVEALLAPWAGIGPRTWPLLGLAVLAQGLRYWAISTLGRRWCIRVVTLPGAPRIASGPYRWFPHPNYVAVFAESVALTIAFGAWITAAIAIPLTGLALLRRIRLEERALGGGPHGHLA
jgi:methyltransferase